MQMAFKSERYGTESDYHKMSVAERSFKSTREHYGTYRAAGTTGPVERFAHNKPCGQEDGVFEADLCDRCGIDGNALDGMHRCWSCWKRGTEVVSHLSCIDSHELVWLLGDEEDRHWRCRQCRLVFHSVRVYQP